jgi:F-type H+-transporting ATPase subunit delta
MTGSIARRYAKALFAVAREANSLVATASELERLASVAAAPEVAAALANPLLSETRRRQLATAISDDLSLSAETRTFVCVLADHKRLDQLTGIADHFRRLLDRHLGQVRATITASAPLDTADVERIVELFSAKTGKKVLAATRVEPGLLGGVMVDIEGKVYDGSLRTQLRGLAESIARGRSYL